MCSHSGPTVDPDNRDAIGGPVTTSSTSKFISETFRGVAKQPSVTEFCLYTVSVFLSFCTISTECIVQMSPDDNPVLDRHPHYDNIIIAAGFSGRVDICIHTLINLSMC